MNVLMVGGRRTGKTSVMAAIQKNIQSIFPAGELMLDMENPNSLILFRKEQEARFDDTYADVATLMPDVTPSTEKKDYMCHVKFYGRNAGVDINFIDIPGEWFINAEFESKVKDVLRSSQILLIAIDSPHLMEAEGKYHEIYNRAEVITEQIKQAFQGSLEPRMVLFVPMKCEKYKNRGRMKELTDRVLEGYEELITYLTAAGDGRLYTVAISPCITMGGCEFLRFVLPTDEEGNYETDENGEILPDISIDPATGHRIMNWRAQYRYLTDEDGDHYYEPKDCEQPLLYLLTYYTRILHLQCQNGGWWQGIWAFIRKQANVQQILNGQNLIGEKIKRDAEAGFKVLHDPLEAF